jgi:hypothetical protein
MIPQVRSTCSGEIRADLFTAPRLGGFGQKLEGSGIKVHFTTPATAPRRRSRAVAPPRFGAHVDAGSDSYLGLPL